MSIARHIGIAVLALASATAVAAKPNFIVKSVALSAARNDRQPALRSGLRATAILLLAAGLGGHAWAQTPAVATLPDAPTPQVSVQASNGMNHAPDSIVLPLKGPTPRGPSRFFGDGGLRVKGYTFSVAPAPHAFDPMHIIADTPVLRRKDNRGAQVSIRIPIGKRKD